MDRSRATLFRQTQFAEFEAAAHAKVEGGEALTKESLNELYYGLNKAYYGDGIIHDEQIAYEWARIPHFYRSFYVYQYATGFCSAVAIAQQILDTGDPSDYLAFLKTGASDYPIEELKLTGVDLTSPEPVKRAMEVFAKTVDELSELI